MAAAKTSLKPLHVLAGREGRLSLKEMELSYLLSVSTKPGQMALLVIPYSADSNATP